MIDVWEEEGGYCFVFDLWYLGWIAWLVGFKA